MSSGPNGGAGSRPSPEPELPGEFVSEDLRADCGRFLNELRARVELRRELAPESGAWVPSHVSDPACPDVIAQGRLGAEAQSSPNSSSAHSGR
jgi:hypothetical protein